MKQMKVILNITNSQLSIARHYGHAKVNGQEYIYIKPFDALILKSLVRPYNKFKKDRLGRPADIVWNEFLDALQKGEI